MTGTLLLLVAFTGSLPIPIKAVILTGASLAASLDALTYVFQQGHLAGLIGFTPIDGLDPITLLLAATFAFGLATDYEVFVRSGTATSQAVERGMQRTGRTITTAVAPIITVFVGFAIVKHLAIVKQLGIGLAIAVTRLLVVRVAAGRVGGRSGRVGGCASLPARPSDSGAHGTAIAMPIATIVGSTPTTLEITRTPSARSTNTTA